MTSSVTEQLVRFILGFEGIALPHDAIYNSKVAILDCVGVALAGSGEPIAQVMREYVQTTSLRKEATIWGTDSKVFSLEAALVNGVMAHTLDYDDCNRVMLGHPSAVLVPAIFAIGEKIGCLGQKLLKGYILGLEVAAKLGQVLNPGLYEKGWHPTSVLGIMGACAGACFLLGLNYEKTTAAMGIAASEASGIKKNFGTMVKPLHAGSASRKGIWAALLAERGLTADPQSLDGTFGFLDLFKGDIPYDVEPISHLGKPLEITSSGLVIKQYPCCGSIHSLIDGIIDIRQKEGIHPAQAEEIECRINPQRIPHINRPRVRSGLDGKFSLQYCVAAAFIDGRIGFIHFAEESIGRVGIQSLMDKIRITPDGNLGDFASEINVRTADGRIFSRVMPETKGSPALPLSESEVMQKFMDCAMKTMSSSQAEKAGRRIMSIEGENGLGPIVRLLSPQRNT